MFIPSLLQLGHSAGLRLDHSARLWLGRLFAVMCHTLQRIFQCLRDAFLHVLAVYAVVRPQRDNRDTRFCADCRHPLVPLAALVLMVGRVVDLHSDFRRKGCVGNQEIHIAE